MRSTEKAHPSSRIIHLVILLMALLLIGYAVTFSWNSWREEKSSQIHNLQNITELAEKAIDTYFYQLQGRMLGLTREIVETDGAIDLHHAFSAVKRFKESHSELVNITFMREDGQILFTAFEPPGEELPTLAQEPSFQKFRDELRQGHPLSISQPLESLTISEWIIPLRYVIYDLEGNPAHIISANLPSEILQNFWKGAPFTRKAALGLIRDDGILVSRYPIPENIDLESVYSEPRKGTLITYLKAHHFPGSGFVEGPSGLDGPDFLQAFRRLEHFPITLFVAMPLSDIRTAWWNKVKVPYSLSILLIIGGFVLFNTVRNISERLKLERESVYSQILKTSIDMFAILDTKGRFLEMNPAGLELLGYSHEEITRLTVNDIDAEEEPDRAIHILDGLKETGHQRFETRIRCKDSRLIDVDISVSYFRYRGERIVCFIRDISRRKQRESELLKARDEAEKAVQAKNEVLTNLEDIVSSRTKALEKAMIFAEAANRVKSTFLSNMSHELRTPLNVITGFAFLMKKDPLTARQADYLDKLSTSARELLQLINDILDFARIDDPVLTLEVQNFEPARIAHLVCLIFSDQAKEKNVELTVDLRNVPAVLQGDGDRLGRILHQLIGNAVKFTDKGSIRLAMSVVEKIDNVIVLRCEIWDTGIGMTADQLKVIFQAFEQGDGSLTRRFGGIGLGLALTKRLVEGMHGHIGVESEIGRGSVFWLEIPFEESSSPAKAITCSGPYRQLNAFYAEIVPESGEKPSSIPEPEAAVVLPENKAIQTVSFDNSKVTLILNQLEDLLADNNTTASDLFDRSRLILTSALGNTADQIDRQIQDFDFEEALRTLRTARNANGFAQNEAA